MSLSEIRVNTTKTRTGVGTITYTETGPVITGIATASNFKTGTSNLHNVGIEIAGINVLGADTPIGTGATIYNNGNAKFIGTVTAANFSGTGNITAVDGVFSGDVSIGGTLTYEDVTNIDAVGMVTARNGLKVLSAGANITGNSELTGLLTIDTTNHEKLKLRAPAGEANDWSYMSFFGTDGNRNGYIGADATGDLVIQRDGGKALFLDSTGLGIGESNPDTLLELSSTQSGTGNLLKLTSTTNSQSSRPGIVFWNNNPNTAQAQISAKGGASYNASKLHFAVANTSRTLVDRVCIDEYGTFIIGPGETRRNTKGSSQYQALLVEGTNNNSSRMSMIRSSNDDNGPEIQLIKTRGTSVGSVTKPNGQDYIGALTFIAGDDSDLASRSAEIAVQAQGVPANDTCPGDIIFSVTNIGSNAPTERLRIGATGITTTSASISFPDNKMAIFGNSSDLQIWHDSNNSRISDRGGAGNLQIESNNAILLQTNDSTNCMAKFFPTGTYQNEFYNDNAWGHPKLRTTDKGIDIFHDGDFGLQFSDGIGEIGDVAGFQAVNKAMSANTAFGIRANDFRFASGSSEVFRIIAGGKVGINETNPASQLVVRAATDDNPSILLYRNSGGGDVGALAWGSSQGTNARINWRGGGGDMGMSFLTSAAGNDGSIAERFRISSDGKCLIRSQGATDSDCYAGLEIRQNTGGKHLVLATNSATSSTNDVMLGFKLHPSGQDERVKGAIICRGTGANDYGQPSRLSLCLEPNGNNTNVSISNELFSIRNGGEARVSQFLTIARDNNNTSNFTKGGLVLNTPAYAEYHYTWSGQSSYTIDLTCASYFHAEFTYVQHQTNGGVYMQYYARGKWANNHTTHTGVMWEWHGDGGGLDVQFTVSDQSGNGAVNMRNNFSGNGANGTGYVNGGGEGQNTGSANGRLRIAETYSWGSVSNRALIVKVYYGSFSISKS